MYKTYKIDSTWTIKCVWRQPTASKDDSLQFYSSGYLLLDNLLQFAQEREEVSLYMKNEQILLHNKPHFSPPRSLHGNVINETNHVTPRSAHHYGTVFASTVSLHSIYRGFFHFFDNAATMMEDQWQRLVNGRLMKSSYQQVTVKRHFFADCVCIYYLVG